MYNEFKSSTNTSAIVSDALYHLYVNHSIQWEDGNHTGVMLTLKFSTTECQTLYVLVSKAGSNKKFYALEVDNKLLHVGDYKSVVDVLHAYIEELIDPWF